MGAAGTEEIRRWFTNGVAQGHQYMVIVFDSWDYLENPDTPHYADDKEKTQALVEKFNNDASRKVMEVYDLTADMEEQLAERRAWRL